MARRKKKNEERWAVVTVEDECFVFTCPCSAQLPRSSYAVAQLAQGHILTTTCEACQQSLSVNPADVRAVRVPMAQRIRARREKLARLMLKVTP